MKEKVEFELAVRYALEKIKELGLETYLYDPAKTVSQDPEQLVYLLAKYIEEGLYNG